MLYTGMIIFFFSSRRRHTRCSRDWSSDVCSSDWYTALDTMRVAKRRMRGKDKEMNAGSKKPTERKRLVEDKGNCGGGERATRSSVGLDTRKTSCYRFFPYRHPCARRLGSEQEPANVFKGAVYAARFSGGPAVWGRPDAQKTLPSRNTKPSLIASRFS